MESVLLRGALLLLLLPAVVNTESHWESYAGWAMGYTWTCFPYYYTFCSDWYSYPYYLGYNSCTCSQYQPYSKVCYQAMSWNCYTNCAGWIPVTLWRCQSGWQGANCDVPICDSPACNVYQICIRPNTCDCPRSSTGECIHLPCDDGPAKNCYPGFCNQTGGWSCACPAGFSGPNCQTITNTPEIKACYVQIFGTPYGQPEQEVARASECAAPGLNPLPVWIGLRGANQLTKIVVNWEAHYDNQLILPDKGLAPYIINAPVPIGIVETNFTVSFPNTTTFTPQSTFCIGPDPVYDYPPTIKQCNGLLRQWSDLGVASLVKTNASFVVTIEAQVGGVKKGDPQWSGGRFYVPQVISMNSTMNTTIRTTMFAFDLEPPYHCLSRSNCSIFPIFLNRSVSNDPIIQPTFNGWNDDASGLDRFYVEVYYMQPDSDNLLVPVGQPLWADNVNITLNNFRFACPKPGAYSIVLTVYDKANNSAKARKIFNYDNHDTSFYETTSPIYLSAADPNTDYKFITQLQKPADGISPYQFTVIWNGHFVNSIQSDWLLGVDPWPTDPSLNLIDDNRGSTFGLRSIDSFTKETGVSGYELAYKVDSNNTGGIGAVAPSTFIIIKDRSTSGFPINISSTLKDGDSIVVWLKVYDFYGKMTTIVTKTLVDTSRFNIQLKTQTFAKHFPDQFNSSVVIDVVNKISGIKNITYEIYDATKQLSVRTGTVLPQVLEPPSALPGSRKRSTVDLPCLSTDPTCYCIPLGYCYNRTQLINIDNCWIDRVAGDQVTVKYTVYSLAGWGLPAEINAGTLSQEDISCRSLTLNLTGIIIGSVFGGILLILLIILLILMCVRWKCYHMHPVPTKIRTTIHNTFGRNSAPTINIVSDNELYASKEEMRLEPTSKNSKESRLWVNQLWDVQRPTKSGQNFEDFLVSGKNLHIGDVIAEGRFAVIRKGFLTDGNEKNPVAIKALRSGYDKGDPELMKAKIDFMANQFKPHPNIIRFIGIVADDEQVPPVMLLELCDKTLKDWLSEISTVDTEVLEDMLSFTLHIARGVQHLHDQKIIHRRLAVRNVLLKWAIGGYEAKLIGFGPSRDDSDDKPNDQSTLGLSVVPLKWMAPETLDTLNSRKPTYDEKTDTWSFGVTIWEIYSKGDAPYASHKSADIRAVLKRGERLTCPEACHPDLFNNVIYPCWNVSPKKRPSFTTICTFLQQFRNGVSASGGGYYAAPSVSPGGAEAPPGYYEARNAFQDNSGRLNNAIYHDARSG